MSGDDHRLGGEDSVAEAKALFRACVEREEGAWETFLARYSKLIYYSIHRTFKLRHLEPSPEEIADLFHDVLVHFLKDEGKRLRAFRGDGGCSPATWIRTVTVRFTIDYLRKKERSPGREDILEEGISLEASLANPVRRPDEIYEGSEQDALLAEAFAALPEKDRYFAELYFKQGLAPEEVARLFGLSVKTIYSRANRIKGKLLDFIEKKGKK